MITPHDRTNPYAAPSQGPVLPAPPTPGGAFAPCPSCGCTHAENIKWTIWGGLIGPKMLHHVRCHRCGTAYNGKTGKDNTAAITVFLVVGIVLGFVLGLLVYGVW